MAKKPKAVGPPPLVLIHESKTRAQEFEQKLKVNPEEAYHDLVAEAGQIAFNLLVGEKDYNQEALTTARDYIKLIAEARREAINYRKEILGREKWEFDVSRMCMEHIAELKAALANKKLNETQRIAQIRNIIFGTPLPQTDFKT